MRRNSLWLLILLLAAPALAAEETENPLRYRPASKAFACDIPSREWRAFEEEDASGLAVHILGPDGPSRNYRTGIDVRLIEKGSPGFLPFKDALERMRRADKEAARSATGVAHLKVGGALARIFEVTETRWLPEDSLPSMEEPIHHYVAVVPSGESYWVIRLSSSREVYLDYRDLFVKFLKSFKPLGS